MFDLTTERLERDAPNGRYWREGESGAVSSAGPAARTREKDGLPMRMSVSVKIVACFLVYVSESRYASPCL